MELRSTDVFADLKDQGARRLYHANSVPTSCNFLRYGALLSRGTVERRKLFQTRQESDVKDKLFGIWYDVFVDTLDIHASLDRRNLYGPVLFVFGRSLVKDYPYVWITRNNPIHWVGSTNEQRHKARWFWSLEHMQKQFQVGNWGQCIVFRNCGGELPFNGHLKEIILDFPWRCPGRIRCYNLARAALLAAMEQGGIDVPITRRDCAQSCRCRREYGEDPELTQELFHPSYAAEKRKRLRALLKRK